jgi:hypothetical protein
MATGSKQHGSITRGRQGGWLVAIAGKSVVSPARIQPAPMLAPTRRSAEAMDSRVARVHLEWSTAHPASPRFALMPPPADIPALRQEAPRTLPARPRKRAAPSFRPAGPRGALAEFRCDRPEALSSALGGPQALTPLGRASSSPVRAETSATNRRTAFNASSRERYRPGRSCRAHAGPAGGPSGLPAHGGPEAV